MATGPGPARLRDKQALGSVGKRRQYPLVVDRTEGARIVDEDGRDYVDWTSGFGVAGLGFARAEIDDAYRDAIVNEPISVLACHPSSAAVELAGRLIELAPGNFEKRTWFGLAGTDALDFVAKMAPLREGRRRLVCFVGGFAGSSVGASAISGHHALARPIAGGHITKAPYPIRIGVRGVRVIRLVVR